MSLLAHSVMEYSRSKEVCLALSPASLAVLPACCVSEQRSCSNPIPSLAVPPLCYKEIRHHTILAKRLMALLNFSLPTGTDTRSAGSMENFPSNDNASLRVNTTGNNGRHSAWADTTQMLA